MIQTGLGGVAAFLNTKIDRKIVTILRIAIGLFIVTMLNVSKPSHLHKPLPSSMSQANPASATP